MIRGSDALERNILAILAAAGLTAVFWLALGLLFPKSPAGEVSRQASETQAAIDRLARVQHEYDSLAVRYYVASRRADSLSQSAAASREIARIATRTVHIGGPPPLAVPLRGTDTVRMVGAAREGDSTRYPIPAFVADAYYALARYAARADSALDAEQLTRAYTESLLRTARAERLWSDSALVATQRQLKLTEALARPRFGCGTKCGAALGALAVVTVRLAIR